MEVFHLILIMQSFMVSVQDEIQTHKTRCVLAFVQFVCTWAWHADSVFFHHSAIFFLFSSAAAGRLCYNKFRITLDNLCCCFAGHARIKRIIQRRDRGNLWHHLLINDYRSDLHIFINRVLFLIHVCSFFSLCLCLSRFLHSSPPASNSELVLLHIHF